MAFLGEDDLLVMEKNDGTLRRIVDGVLLPDPLLDVNVGNLDERGMLGLAISRDDNENVKYIFVYYTEMPDRDGSDVNGTLPVANKLFRYEFDGERLFNGKLLLEIPAKYTDNHNGGSMLIGPDDNLYITVGDQQEPGQQPFTHITTAQNKPDTLYPDLTGGILRMTQDGKPVENLFGGKYPIDMYYAYGVRNSFGIDFDPVSGVLWDTENGPDLKDEINRVEPGFNSGWRYLQGFIEDDTDLSQLVEFPGLSAAKDSVIGRAEAVSFKAQGLGGKFSEPEFVWQLPIAPTALVFLGSEELGDKYENDLFVASFNRGEIYNFNLNDARTELVLTGPLEDKVENNPAGYPGLKFARNFGGITEMVVGPDGYLYVNGFFNGNIYRILSVEDAEASGPLSETFSLQIAGQTYDINYQITNGTVRSMNADPETKTLAVTIEPTGDGVLTIELPRSVIDADDDFEVVVDLDGDATVVESRTTPLSRRLAIDFSQENGDIAIVGTSMVPEFGVISAVVLATGVAATVIVASWKFSIYRRGSA
jgi:glucose/arabinose dehydrogenase